MRRMTMGEALLEAFDVAGKTVIDVGSGDGTLTRLMASKGAQVLGLECGPAQLAKALESAPVGGERYVDGVAQAMPAAEASADIVVFVNSLHHVPVDAQRTALDEAARVLVDGGMLFIAEPLAEGPMYELMRPIDDEGEVRAAAYRQIMDAPARGFEPVWEKQHLMSRRVPDFDSLREGSIRIDPARAPRFAALDAELRAGFEKLATRLPEGGWELVQPIRTNLLRRRPRR
jgi:ubiquinone/menaquinone biosynthesis C-methylase UbiE